MFIFIFFKNLIDIFLQFGWWIFYWLISVSFRRKQIKRIEVKKTRSCCVAQFRTVLSVFTLLILLNWALFLLFCVFPLPIKERLKIFFTKLIFVMLFFLFSFEFLRISSLIFVLGYSLILSLVILITFLISVIWLMLFVFRTFEILFRLITIDLVILVVFFFIESNLFVMLFVLIFIFEIIFMVISLLISLAVGILVM